jgi:leucine dehydrogenase
VLVQGVGSVGAPLAELLATDGARLILTDVDDARAQALAERLDARTVPTDSAAETACDIYAPCATGGMLRAETIPRLRARVVAGSANNQLGERADADRLRVAGILYAPDYVISGGGVLYAVGREALGWDDEQVESALAGIGDTLTRIYERADEAGTTTLAAADELAAARLGEATSQTLAI